MLSAAPGTLDPSFSLDGKATVDFGRGVATSDVAVQADGKTVVAGTTTGALGVGDFAVARFNFDGTLDTTFGPNHQGFLTTPLGDDHQASASAVAIQPDGKIVVAGWARDETFFTIRQEFAIARYMPDGTLDRSFDGDGMQLIATDDHFFARDIALQKDGKIILAGYEIGTGLFNEGEVDFAVVRLNSNGSRDTSFGDDGVQTVDFGFGSDDFGKAVAIDYNGSPASNPNYGKIVIAGLSQSEDGDFELFALARLKTNGDLDTGFGLHVGGIASEGFVATHLPDHLFSSASALLIQPDSKIVLAGTTGNIPTQKAGPHEIALARYNSNGTLDRSFGQNGIFDPAAASPSPLDVRVFDMIRAEDNGLVLGVAAQGQMVVVKLPGNDPDRKIGDFEWLTNLAGFGNVGRLAYGLGRRVVFAGGGNFSTARILDTGANQVFVRSFEPNAAEAGPRTANFVVGRTERLPIPTRVYFSIGGTATAPGTFPFSQVDYTLDGMSFDSPTTGTVGTLARAAIVGGFTTSPLTPFGLPYVDIPANQTTARVTLRPIDDARLEPNETATFSILPNAAYEAPTFSSTTLTIFDNDPITINFQPAGVTAPAGIQADTGQIFGLRANGLSFGWDADNTANARQRHNNRSPDALFDSFNHMQKNGANRKWELAVPNGLYQVTLAAGDPDAIDSIYKMNLEGALALSGTPTGDTRWFTRTINVQVNDGRLTLTNALGAKNNKIDFITIRAVPQAGPPPHFNSSVAISLLSLPVVTIVFGFKKDLVNTFAKTLLQ
jgi:uncharacterized delta-60 repeat protein